MDIFEKLVMSITIILILMVCAIGISQPYFESRTYERLTGKHVTYWDAVWCDLRIQEQVK
jgi:hypothetical protein